MAGPADTSSLASATPAQKKAYDAYAATTSGVTGRQTTSTNPVDQIIGGTAFQDAEQTAAAQAEKKRLKDLEDARLSAANKGRTDYLANATANLGRSATILSDPKQGIL